MSDAQRQAMYGQIGDVKGKSDEMYRLIDELGASNDVNETRQEMYSQIGVLKQSVDQMYSQIDLYGSGKQPVSADEPSIMAAPEPSKDAPLLVPSGEIVTLDLSQGEDFNAWYGRKADYIGGGEYCKRDGDVIRQSFSPTKKGSTRTQAQISLPKDVRHRAYAVEMEIMFEPGFEWVLGGKFGFGFYCGFKSRTKWSGGGQNIPNACCCRAMWRKDGQPAAYFYRQNKPPRSHRYGEDLNTRKKMTAGQWHTITLGMSLNSKHNKNDGKMYLGLDGDLQEMSGINWMSAGDLYIKEFIYTAFYGGNNSKWSPKKNTGYQIRSVRHFPIEA